jgi:hypothetical protein
VNEEPLTPIEIERNIRRILNVLEADIEQLRFLGKKSAEAEASYKYRRATERTKARHAGANVGDADDVADLAANEEFRSFKMAVAAHMAQREALESHRSQLVALQSLAKGLRTVV